MIGVTMKLRFNRKIIYNQDRKDYIGTEYKNNEYG